MTERSSKTSGDVNNVRRAIAFVGIMCILISQFLIFSQPVDHTIVFPPYTFLAILGVIIFSFSWFIKPSPILERAASWLLFQDRAFWLFVAFALSGVVTFAIVNLTLFARINYIPVVTLWLFSASAYVYVFWDRSINLSTLVDWFKKNQNELLSVLAVTLLAVVVRFYKLGGIPRILDGDEGLIGLFAQSTTSGTLANPFALWENFGAMYLQLINTSIGLFGVNAFALRLLPAIGGTLAIPSIYLLARWIGGRRIALIAALILA
ncbi:MAG TPA: phospholipid carrier-dependent glycosyltransferase, partial [Anaerolineales bacterium]|nr:phospholipid carrier-dependent glycosyltransferase [Anaerolineales bacterium]